MLRDVRLPPRCKLDLPYFGIELSVEWYFRIDVSGTTFPSRLQGSSSSKTWNCWALEDGTDRLPLNVGTELQLYAALKSQNNSDPIYFFLSVFNTAWNISPIHTDEASSAVPQVQNRCPSISIKLVLNFQSQFSITDRQTSVFICFTVAIPQNVSISKTNVPWGFQVTNSRQGRSLFK